MGESKKRKQNLGEIYGNPDKERYFASIPFTKEQGRFWYKFTVTGTWICIGTIAAAWVIVRLGVAMKWWGVS